MVQRSCDYSCLLQCGSSGSVGPRESALYLACGNAHSAPYRCIVAASLFSSLFLTNWILDSWATGPAWERRKRKTWISGFFLRLSGAEQWGWNWSGGAGGGVSLYFDTRGQRSASLHGEKVANRGGLSNNHFLWKLSKALPLQHLCSCAWGILDKTNPEKAPLSHLSSGWLLPPVASSPLPFTSGPYNPPSIPPNLAYIHCVTAFWHWEMDWSHRLFDTERQTLIGSLEWSVIGYSVLLTL